MRALLYETLGDGEPNAAVSTANNGDLPTQWFYFHICRRTPVGPRSRSTQQGAVLPIQFRAFWKHGAPFQTRPPGEPVDETSVRPRHESLGRQKVRKCPCRIFEGRTAYASVMLAHLFVVVTEEFHDNRLRNSRFLKRVTAVCLKEWNERRRSCGVALVACHWSCDHEFRCVGAFGPLAGGVGDQG